MTGSGGGRSGSDPGTRAEKGARRPTLVGIPGPHERGNAALTPAEPRPGQSQRPSGTSPVSERITGLGWMPNEQSSVLLVGQGHPMQEALAAALTRHGAECETTVVDAVLSAVVAATPSLVLVLGDAAHGSGRAVVGALRSAELDGTVPIVVLLDDASLEARMEAIRGGAAAAIPRSASVDQIAGRIAAIARLSDLARVRAEHLGETTLAELLSVIGRELSERLLPEGARAVDPQRLHLVLGSAPEVVRIVDGFCADLQGTIVSTERAGDEHAADVAGDEGPLSTSSQSIAGVRIVLADDDSGRADHVADELRRLGATVVVTGLVPRAERMQRLRQIDPMVLLMRSEDLAAGGQALLDAMKGDLRLRWVTLVAAEWSELSGPGEAGRAIEALVEEIRRTGDPDRALRDAAEAGRAADVRLESLGPARALRAVSTCSRPVRLVVENPRVQVTVDLSEGLVVGALATEPDDWAPIGEGPLALSALLSLASGRLTLSPITGARALNVMSTVATALDLAESERSPITPSWPPGTLGREMARSVVGEGASASGRATRSLRRWALAGAGLLSVALGIGADRLWVRSERAPAPAATSAPGALLRPVDAPKEMPAESVKATVAPRAVRETAPQSLMARASSGDDEAMAALERLPLAGRSVDETRALAEGRVARARRSIVALGEECRQHPELLSRRETAERWLAHARDESVATDALATLASVPGPHTPDILYAVWTGTPKASGATRMAQELLASTAIRSQATPALSIALDLRAAESCEAMAALLPRAIDDADRRSIRVLGHILGNRRCGPAKNQECYPCLRKSLLVPKAVRAARSRPGPL